MQSNYVKNDLQHLLLIFAIIVAGIILLYIVDSKSSILQDVGHKILQSLEAPSITGPIEIDQ